MVDRKTLTLDELALRISREVMPGDLVAVGNGMPDEISKRLSSELPAWVIDGFGSLTVTDGFGNSADNIKGGSVHSISDVASMMHGGHVDIAIVEAGEVTASGDIVSLSTLGASSLSAPGWSVDLLDNSKRVVAVARHFNSNGESVLRDTCSVNPDGVGCVDMIITDIAVLELSDNGFVLKELATGWSIDDLTTVPGMQIEAAQSLTDIKLGIEEKPRISKLYDTGVEAMADLPDGATVMIDGFAGPGGMPHYLLVSLRDHGARGLTIIGNTAGIARVVNFGTPAGQQAIDHTLLIDNGQVSKAVASYPVSPSASRPTAFELAYRRGDVDLELVPQGTLAERLRSGGAGIVAFYTPTGVGTLIAEGKESRIINGKEYILEKGLRADFCIIRGYKADKLGNVIYKGTSRNFNPVMAPAADITIVEVDEVVEVGDLDPDEIVTPGVYIDRIVIRPTDFSPYE